jgi:putative flavoprotein involved in K+ transport
MRDWPDSPIFGSRGVDQMKNRNSNLQTLVIGGGQAGLSVGYYLAKRGISFQILDANQRVGDAWRKRWDSLRLFTPARYAGLPGMPFPARGDVFLTKDEVADYLESYARRFNLPVRNGVRVDRLFEEDGRFVATSGSQRFEADNVVVAMANYQSPRMPSFARELAPDIVQLHAHDYRNPSQLQDGGVLVVGVGNSGADIAIEVAKTHPTWISGKESGHVPFPIESFMARNVFVRIVRFLGHHILSLGTPIGRKQYAKMLSQAAPLIRVKPEDLVAAGIKRVDRVTGVQNGRPLLADGRTLDVRNVIWCTGYHPGFSWIDLPVFGEDGRPQHDRGVVTKVPGLYFVGLHFLYAMTSATLTGVGRDAALIVRAINDRARVARPATGQNLKRSELAVEHR